MDAQEREDERTALGGAPDSGGVSRTDEERERCESDRAELTPKETAECAGADLAELYENEEDGGS